MTRRNCTTCARWKRGSEFTRNPHTGAVSPTCNKCKRDTRRMRDRQAWARRVRDPRRLPSEPIQLLLRQRLEGTTCAELSRRIGFSPDQIRHLVRGRHKMLNLDTADRWCIALGTHLELLY